MFDRKDNRRKVNLYAVVFMMFVAALFVMSMAGSAGAFPFALQGKIIAIDNDSQKLTLQQDQCGMSGQYGLTWDKRTTTVLRGRELVSFSDLKVGDDITVRYYEKSPGMYVAEDINILPSAMAERC